MKNPFLSIITINYNDAVGLEKTIQSVISQSFKDFEYLVIDGGSKDDSLSIIEKNRLSIDYCVSESDTGIYNAMNKGIRKANGEYLLFLNGGDVLNGRTALEDFINHECFQGDIIYGDYKYEEGGKVFPDRLTPLFFVRTSLPHQSTLFKREIFDKMGLYDEGYKIVSDRDFYIKCFLSNQFVFKHVPYSLSIFDLLGMSNDPQHTEKQVLENERMFQINYGVYYEDYKNMLLLQRQLNQLKRETVSGIMKRIVNKMKKVCRIR
ncbi:glycosyltransferase [Flavobacterium sufflavum]|uniref:Glycosyltransferase n=1 Tax=Flavobacterium sufflavum TaxID=1921138 RepID=A0A437KUN4_9FLAO|nr:glycosyltransferase family 2 protein [Flavobacterium sufflavum]RVT75886.1 glycosyltransferase [Flavobacterium sufflavum]